MGRNIVTKDKYHKSHGTLQPDSTDEFAREGTVDLLRVLNRVTGDRVKRECVDYVLFGCPPTGCFGHSLHKRTRRAIKDEQLREEQRHTTASQDA